MPGDDGRADAPAGTPAADRRGALLAEYGEVGASFRLLTDIRFKLLALLPVAAGAATALVAAGDARDAWGEVQALALSLFGLVVTVALATYNQRNDQLYDALVGRAASIERELGLPDGAYANRPTSWLTIRLPIGAWPVNHRRPVAVIYGASAALWVFGAGAALVQLFWGDDPAPWGLLACAIVPAVAVPAIAARAIRGQRTERERRMRGDAAAAVAQVEEALRAHGSAAGLRDRVDFVVLCGRLGGVRPDHVRARIRFYGSLGPDDRPGFMLDEPVGRRAAQFVALVTDLSAEWLEDCATQRRLPVSPTKKGPR